MTLTTSAPAAVVVVVVAALARDPTNPEPATAGTPLAPVTVQPPQ
jgi:hypothetical protein